MKLKSNNKTWNQYVNPKRVVMICENTSLCRMCLDFGGYDHAELDYESREELEQDRDEIMSHWNDND